MGHFRSPCKSQPGCEGWGAFLQLGIIRARGPWQSRSKKTPPPSVPSGLTVTVTVTGETIGNLWPYLGSITWSGGLGLGNTLCRGALNRSAYYWIVGTRRGKAWGFLCSCLNKLSVPAGARDWTTYGAPGRNVNLSGVKMESQVWLRRTDSLLSLLVSCLNLLNNFERPGQLEAD